MFEPPILDQLMGVGALLLGFAGLAVISNCRNNARKKKDEKSKNLRL